MSPQFVDLDGDGHLDIVAGTFDGSPHLALGTEKGWKQPEQVLDRNGERIVFNQFWNFDKKQWDRTDRCNPEGKRAPQKDGHLTSALAVDFDGDGDLDLLLGDHANGSVYLRRNEGDARKYAFAAKNEVVLADGKPIDVKGTVATVRLVDWNRDGLMDLACGSMGDAYQLEEGGGVYLYLNNGTKQATAYAAPIVLVPPSEKKGKDGPTRPDSGVHVDFGDPDGDGDLDLIVGGYSHWLPEAPALSKDQKARVVELQAGLAQLDKESAAMSKEMLAATEGLEAEAATRKREEVIAAQSEARAVLTKKRSALTRELEPLLPGAKRVSYVWVYENTTGKAAVPGAKGSGGER